MTVLECLYQREVRLRKTKRQVVVPPVLAGGRGCRRVIRDLMREVVVYLRPSSAIPKVGKAA
jgi:hypothetical protein